jgi:hypothetical protein
MQTMQRYGEERRGVRFMSMLACRGERVTRGWARQGRRERDSVLQHVSLEVILFEGMAES